MHFEYQVCLEPVENPSTYEPVMVSADDQAATLTSLVDRESHRRYRVQVTSYIEDANGDKTRRYSESIVNNIDLGEWEGVDYYRAGEKCIF